jgi:ribonuclease VapC
VECLTEQPGAGIGAPTLAEAGVVLAARLEQDSRPLLSRLVEELELVVVPFGARHAREARDAYLRFGKGRHPAALNFGDCISYAVARVAGRSLLFVGDDFRRTDIQPALT